MNRTGRGSRCFTALMALVALALLGTTLPARAIVIGAIDTEPDTLYTTNGCADFDIDVTLSAVDARNFTLRLFLDAQHVDLLQVIAGSDPSLHLMPAQRSGNILYLDGFFHPNLPAGPVTIATLHARAISPADAATHVGFLTGGGFSGESEWPDSIIFGGDSTTVFIEGTAPRPPDSLIIEYYRSGPQQVDSVRLAWRPVYEDADGDPVIQPLYSVEFTDVVNDTTVLVVQTTDTFAYHDYIRDWFAIIIDSTQNPVDTILTNIGTYHVRACKTQP